MHQPAARNLHGVLPGPSEHSGELLKVDILSDLGLLSLVIGVGGDLDIAVLLDGPTPDIGDVLLGRIFAETEPRLEMAKLNLTVGLGDEVGDAATHGVLEAGDVGNQIGAKVVAVDIGPEAGVLSALELTVEGAELGDGLVKLTGGGGGGVDEVEGE